MQYPSTGISLKSKENGDDGYERSEVASEGNWFGRARVGTPGSHLGYSKAFWEREGRRERRRVAGNQFAHYAVWLKVRPKQEV